MDYVKLGKTGLEISRICLGTNMFGAGYVDDVRAMSVIDQAYDEGVNFIDTADAYHSGLSEQLVGKAIKGRRQDFVIATKGFMATGLGINESGLSRKHLMGAVESSLQHLDTDYIDLYQVHYWDPYTPLDETLNTLDDLVHQGKIRYIGCSNFAAWQLTRSLWLSDKLGFERFESIQVEYNLKNRGIENELFPLCLDQTVSILPYQILMGGILTGNYTQSTEPPNSSHMSSRHAQRAKDTYWNDHSFAKVNTLKEISLETGLDPTAIVLAWVLSKSAVTSVIVGSSRPAQIVNNVKASTIKLSRDILNRLEEVW